MTEIEEDEQVEANPPLEVKVVNKEEKKYSIYDSYEDDEYDDHRITDKEIKEFEDGNTRS